jgi:hypothetical protein
MYCCAFIAAQNEFFLGLHVASTPGGGLNGGKGAKGMSGLLLTYTMRQHFPSRQFQTNDGYSHRAGHAPKQPLPQNLAQNQDDADEEFASVTRLPAVTRQLWGSLLKPRGYEISEGELLRSPSKAYAALQPVPQQPPTPVKDVGGGGGAGPFMAPGPSVPQENGENSTAGSSNIFAGLKFLALGEAKTPSVRSAGKVVCG